MRFSDQTALVTGGTRGLGRAITLALLEAGARVHATYRSDEESARDLAERAGDGSERLTLHRSDTALPDDVDALWERLDQDEHGVQIVVANAGIRRDGIVGMMPLDDWNTVLQTNLTGSFLICKRAVQSMLRRRYGRIVLVTSPSGRFGFAGQGNYAASKAGQVALAKSLAREVGKRGITANCVSPGFVDTDLIADLDEETRKAHAKSVPIGRFGQPEEIAHAVLFLASREASYVNGATLEVTGGL